MHSFENRGKTEINIYIYYISKFDIISRKIVAS